MPDYKSNFFLRETCTPEAYTSPSAPVSKKEIVRDRDSHAADLLEQLSNLKINTDRQSSIAVADRSGAYLCFEGMKDESLATKSMDNRQQGIRLLNVKESEGVTSATVFIPRGKESYFKKKVEKYADHSKDTKKGLPSNNDLVSSINSIEVATTKSFWTGSEDSFPSNARKWIEVWLRTSNESNKRDETVRDDLSGFRHILDKLDIRYSSSMILFPERAVLAIRANLDDLDKIIASSDQIAEFRNCPVPSSIFEEMGGQEQREWIDDLLGRVTYIHGETVICILDSGVNREHPLLSEALPAESMFAAKPIWGVADSCEGDGHGTCVAGIALFDDLGDRLASADEIQISHRLESVKLYDAQNPELDSELFGDLTITGVNEATLHNEEQCRVICSAVTASIDEITDGSPTSWSAAVDGMIARCDAPEEEHELFLVSAGNVTTQMMDLGFPDSNAIHSVRSPGQAWNALTVGAYCDNDVIKEKQILDFGYKPVAGKGNLSSYSTTSVQWQKKAPIKPEVLFSGGDMISKDNDYSNCSDLSLLTTGARVTSKPITAFSATSAAVAKAAWMAAELRNAYPDLWPETIRALIVHSARWTDEMIDTFCKPGSADDAKTKGRRRLLRHCGYGVPNLNRAMYSLESSVNLVIQGEIKPYCIKQNEKQKRDSMNEMHFHKIPWPRDELEKLGSADATLRVTLSYYIEPGPGQIGWKDRYRYASHGLRFDVCKSGETFEEFKTRMNISLRSEEDGRSTSDSGGWFLGTGNRNVGSIHSDFKTTTAIDLADVEYIAVYPVVGWWRTRKYLEKIDSVAKYALVVSIETQAEEAKLYSEIANKISIPITYV